MISVATELEIRKEQRRILFELLEVRISLAEKNSALEKMVRRHKACMLEEDIAWVEKMVKSDSF